MATRNRPAPGPKSGKKPALIVQRTAKDEQAGGAARPSGVLDGAPLRSQDLLTMQRMSGNKAVMRMLDSRRNGVSQRPNGGKRSGSSATAARTVPSPKVNGVTPQGAAGPMALEGEQAPPERQNGQLALVQKLAEDPAIQRSRAGRMVKAQLWGLGKTTLPIFGWKDYYDSLKDIKKGGETDEKEKYTAQEKYGGVFGRWLNVGVETSDRIASLATSIAFVTAIIGTILTAAAMGAGAVLVGIGTIAGIVATIAHTVTAGLRILLLIYDGIRMKSAAPGSKERALIKAKIWRNIGGLISNVIGAVVGGLAGGFDVSAGVGASGPLSGAVTGDVGATDAPAAMAGIGEGANRIADASAATGDITGHGREKRWWRKQQTDDSSEEEIDIPRRRRRRFSSSSSSSSSERSSSSEDLSEVLEEVSKIGRAASKDKSAFKTQASEEEGVKSGMEQAKAKTDDILPETEKASKEIDKAKGEVDTGLSGAAKELKQKGGSAKKLDVDALEDQVVELEKQVDNDGGKGAESSKPALQKATAEIKQAPKPPKLEKAKKVDLQKGEAIKHHATSRIAPSSADIKEAPVPPQVEQAKTVNYQKGEVTKHEAVKQTAQVPQEEEKVGLKVDRSGSLDEPLALRDRGNGTHVKRRVKGRELVQRGLRERAKQLAGRIAAKVVSLKRRLNKVKKKIVAKFTQATIKIMGIEGPLQDARMEQKQAMQELPQSVAANKEGAAVTEAIQGELPKLRAGISKAQEKE